MQRFYKNTGTAHVSCMFGVWSEVVMRAVRRGRKVNKKRKKEEMRKQMAGNSLILITVGMSQLRLVIESEMKDKCIGAPPFGVQPNSLL